MSAQLLACRSAGQRGMRAGAEPLAATFWLINAPDSLAAQSRHSPDGAGIGCFAGDDSPMIDSSLTTVCCWVSTG